MGYGGFYNLRKNIAYATDPELGKMYERLLDYHVSDKAFCSLINKMIENRKVDDGIVHFLLLSDAGGSVDYKICKSIYDVIKDIDFGDKGFQYASYRNNDYETFKTFLKDCYRYHRKMRWE